MNGFLIAAPSSGAGKTLVTLGLLRAFKEKGDKVFSAKAGPDYIDPAFHAAATGRPCFNLDPWAMRQCLIHSVFSEMVSASDTVIVEGMMGLFDGAADGSASAADLAESLALPVILVVDASSMSFSVAALVRGFRDFRPSLNLAGVILNKVGSKRHEDMLRKALSAEGIAVFGAIPRDQSIELPSRHLGLVQAGEHEGLEMFISRAAEHVSTHCDMAALSALGTNFKALAAGPAMPPLGQRISVARDRAFAFSYPHMLEDWRKQGVELSFFSPLANEAPEASSDAVFLPGGYPELHADMLSKAERFKRGMVEAVSRNALVYGECGGYMVLGEGIIDGEGEAHSMLGLLKLETSFAKRKLHLGYRQMNANGFALGDTLKGHEFHYTSATCEEGEPLFTVSDALGNDLGATGLRDRNVMGSYLHVIDRVA